MKKDADDLPTVSATSLGVRPGKDVDLDAQNNVLVNGKGMSVAPNWREINIHRIPKRLSRRNMTTNSEPLTMNSSYVAMVRGTRELHQLIRAGKDDSPEADAIRDATDGPWQALSEIERNRIRHLSEDLYSLGELHASTQPMTPRAQARLLEAFEARQRGEWDRALDLLRRWQEHIDPSLVAYLRGSIWLEAGDPETAALFYGHAYKLEPTNGNYQAMALHSLHIADPPAALKEAERILLRCSGHAVLRDQYSSDRGLRESNSMRYSTRLALRHARASPLDIRSLRRMPEIVRARARYWRLCRHGE